MKTKSLFVCGVLLVAFGCGKGVQKPESVTSEASAPLNSVPASPANSNAPRPLVSPSAQQPATDIRPTSPVMIPQPVTVPADSAAALGALTQAVRKFSAENQRVPKSLNEVISAGYVTSLPKAPAGKKYVLNIKRLEVVLEND